MLDEKAFVWHELVGSTIAVECSVQYANHRASTSLLNASWFSNRCDAIFRGRMRWRPPVASEELHAQCQSQRAQPQPAPIRALAAVFAIAGPVS